MFLYYALQWIAFGNKATGGFPHKALVGAAEASILRLTGIRNIPLYDRDRLADVCGCLVNIGPEKVFHFFSEDDEISDLNDGVTFAHYSVQEHLDSNRDLSSVIGHSTLIGKDLSLHLWSLTLTESEELDKDNLSSVLSSIPEKSVFLNETYIDGAQEKAYDQLIRFCLVHFRFYSVWLAIFSLDGLYDGICHNEELKALAIDFLNPSKPHSPVYESLMSALQWQQDTSHISCGVNFAHHYWTLVSDAKTENAMKHFAKVIFMAQLTPDRFSLAESFLLRKNCRTLLQTPMHFSIHVKDTFVDGWNTFKGSFIEIFAQMAFIFSDAFEFVMRMSVG